MCATVRGLAPYHERSDNGAVPVHSPKYWVQGSALPGVSPACCRLICAARWTAFGASNNFVIVINEIEQVALRAARAAGRIHLKRLSRITINRKSNSIDLVTEADREAEAAIIEVIHRAFPTHV